MRALIHDFITRAAEASPGATALVGSGKEVTYDELASKVARVSAGLRSHDLLPDERVAVYLEKRTEAVVALFAAAHAGGAFVPVNPLLKAEQVGHILRDCNVRILVTSAARLATLRETLPQCPDLHSVVLVDGDGGESEPIGHVRALAWTALADTPQTTARSRTDSDLAAILYTSGSTGRPKGVVLSHRNLVAGAESVASYLGNTPEDRILAVLPLSFDYGLSQLTTAFRTGATAVLMNYLLPRDVIRAVARERITGLGAVPPLWIQLAELEWPEAAAQSLRYITNTGGAMPRHVVAQLREKLPNTQVFLMYGLTEAFRSTYLPPEEVDRRPDSIGKAIPNAEIRVLREDGTECAPNEPGELVHRGPLVSQGYWNAPEKTAERFRPLPHRPYGLTLPEMAVWSGDTVRRDEEGFLYFVGRRDEMIKTSGYRVSPNEIEEVLYEGGLVGEAAAFGIAHPTLGQGIVVVATPGDSGSDSPEPLTAYCRQRLPGFMVPSHIELRPGPLPRNANGKIDRKALSQAFAGFFEETPE